MSLTVKFPMSHVTKPKNAHVAMSNLVVHAHTTHEFSRLHGLKLVHVLWSFLGDFTREQPRGKEYPYILYTGTHRGALC